MSSFTKFMGIDRMQHLARKPRFSGDLLGSLSVSKRNSGIFSREEEEAKVDIVRQQLLHIGIPIEPPKIQAVLRGVYAGGDIQRAVELLQLEQDSKEGIVLPVRWDVKLQGAVNRHKTSCYLDSILFAMFARLDSFEAILYNMFEDEKRKKLSALLRLFTNIIRSGKLVTVDIIEEICNSLAECGWPEAQRKEQQDASEAFTFITDKLNLPLLTLKMDLQHGAKEALEDDHQFINERLLSIALPKDKGEVVHLSDCLEDFFSDRVEVRREIERRNTISSVHSIKSAESLKSAATHIETTEVASEPQSSAGTPKLSSNSVLTLVRMKSDGSQTLRSKKGTLKAPREVTVPAWCFFSVLPFYTRNSIEEAGFAEHFSSKRPVLGLCLKRYSWSPDGKPIRNGVRIEIPFEIPLPTFVSDDELGGNDGPVYGNFKLVLKSAVCHRGKSITSGHYIALVKEDAPDAAPGSWLIFDDLALERVRRVDGEKAFAEETPYLLFYQVEPIDSEPLTKSGQSTPNESNTEDYFKDAVVNVEKPSSLSPAASIKEGSITSPDGSTAQGEQAVEPGSVDSALITPDSIEQTDTETGKGSSKISSPWKKLRPSKSRDINLSVAEKLQFPENAGEKKEKHLFRKSKGRDKGNGDTDTRDSMDSSERTDEESKPSGTTTPKKAAAHKLSKGTQKDCIIQ